MAKPRDRRRDAALDEQPLSGPLVLATGLAHLLGMHDLAGVVECGTEAPELAVESHSTTAASRTSS